MKHDHIVHFEFQHSTPFEAYAHIKVAPSLVDYIYQSTVERCASEIHLAGFKPGSAPVGYVERHYHAAIMTYLRDFLDSFCAEVFLREQLREKQLVMAGAPKCIASFVELHKPASFEFTITIIPIAVSTQWKHAHFRAPARKNYRDLDNQVTAFLAEEHSATIALADDRSIAQHDWVGFLATPCGKKVPLCDPMLLWMHIGSEDPDLEARELFVNKTASTTFFSEASLLQGYFRSFHDRQYSFELLVKHHAQARNFNIDRFKQYFKLKSDKELHRKLVEVFSFRQDISLRRETAEAALRVALRYHPFHVPFQFVQQEAELLLENICSNPDYYVYKSSPDFREKVQLLAQKRVKEAALMDAVAYAENITVQEQDILDYFNLLKRPRTKEFVYFTLPETRVQERETPLPHDTVAQICLREKTLNHIIQLLVRNSV